MNNLAGVEIRDAYIAEVSHQLTVEDVVANGDEEGTTKKSIEYCQADADWYILRCEPWLNGDLWESEGETGANAGDDSIAYPLAVLAVNLPCRDQTTADGCKDRAAMEVLDIASKFGRKDA